MRRTLATLLVCSLALVCQSSPNYEQEIQRSRVFNAPLLFTGRHHSSMTESRALVKALEAFSFQNFLDQYPHSGWRASVLVNLVGVYRSSGHCTKALSAYEEAPRAK